MGLELVDPEGSVYANTLLVGPPKTGKTAGACSAPGKILLLNTDLPNATLFARKRDTEKRIHQVQIPRFDRENPDTMMELLGAVTHDVMAGNWDTVILDTVGELYRRMLEAAARRAVRPSLPTYGDVSTHLERFCRKMCEDAPAHFVMVAHEAIVSNGDEVEKIAFTGTKKGSETLSGKLMAMVDIIGYTRLVRESDGQVRSVARLLAGDGEPGGDRFDVLGPERELNLSEWFDLAGITTKEKEKE